MNAKDLIDQKNQFFLKTSPATRGALAFCIVVGVISIVAGMTLGLETRTWGSVLFNLFFFFAIALGGSAFAAMQDLIGAKWGRPVMRLHESFTAFLPVAATLFLVFVVCIFLKVLKAHEVYVWIADHEMLHHLWGKRTWLQQNFMLGRVIFCLTVILCIVRWQIGLKVKRDRAFAEGKDQEATALAAKASAALRYWSAPILVTYALTFSCLAFDLLKSLAPTWVSTLFAGWCFAVMMQTLMAMILVWMFSLKETNVGRVFQRQQFHDIGKLMHGFTIFFAYLTYAHVITIWYGNMPEETSYFIHRMQKPWLYIVIGAPIACFLIPLFALIPKASKWTKGITMPIALFILAAQWFVMLLVVQPQVVQANQWGLPWLEIGVFLGMLGIFMGSVFRFGKTTPMIAVGDPLLREALEGHH